ncbi:MAG: DUF1990 family protein [Anaerolineales bacterium]|nr:DUF1990 family protein [Anaerolineales bacterium]
MSDPTTPPTREETNWAKPTAALHTGALQSSAINLNVEGRQLTGPLKGFGQMWQKTYWVRLEGAAVTPEQVIATWKAEFPSFWPKGNRFFKREAGIKPGEVAVLNLAVPGGPPVTAISTGIMVIYADEVSFSFMTPEGHMFAGMITFSAEEAEGATVARIQALIRPSDPFFELMFRIGVGHKGEDKFWLKTLGNLAARLSAHGEPQMKAELIDPRVQWSEAGMIWKNAAIRTGMYLPVAWTKRLLGR